MNTERLSEKVTHVESDVEAAIKTAELLLRQCEIILETLDGIRAKIALEKGSPN
jgi:hypothetical protein